MSFKNGIKAFIVITIISVFIVIFLTADKSTKDVFMRANKLYLLLALFFVVIAWFFDVLRFRCLARCAGEYIPMKLAWMLVWLNYFGAAITPLQSGGGPFQVYVLYKNGVPIGKGVAITLIRTLMTLFILGFLGPLVVVLDPNIIKGNFLEGVFFYVVLFVAFSWLLVFVSLFKPDVMKKIFAVCVLWLSKIGIVRKSIVFTVIKRISAEIDNYNSNFKIFFGKGIVDVIWALLFSFLNLLFLFAVLPCITYAIGFKVSIIKAILMQALFMFVLYFVPTPGGSGVAEGGGTVIFGMLLPMNVAGVVAILWRFFTEYIAIFLGGIVAIKLLGLSDFKQLKEK